MTVIQAMMGINLKSIFSCFFWMNLTLFSGLFFCFAASAFCTQLAYYLDVSCFRPWISNLVDSVRDLWGRCKWLSTVHETMKLRSLAFASFFLWHWLPVCWRLNIISYVSTFAFPHHSKVSVLKVLLSLMSSYLGHAWRVIDYFIGRSSAQFQVIAQAK